jgi:hypothetical protein
MSDNTPVISIRATYVDTLVAEEVAHALNTWFRWMTRGSEMPPPEAFESLGVETAEFAWSLGEDVDWQMGPHARTVEEEVRISLETHDTHLRLAGLLKRLGARRVSIERDEDESAGEDGSAEESGRAGGGQEGGGV